LPINKYKQRLNVINGEKRYICNLINVFQKGLVRPYMGRYIGTLVDVADANGGGDTRRDVEENDEESTKESTL